MIALIGDSPYLVITWTSLVIAILSFVYSLWQDKRTDRFRFQNDYISQLENRIETLEHDSRVAEEKIKVLESKHEECMKENLILLRKVAALPV